MTKEEKNLGLTHVSVLRRQEPKEAHSKPSRKHKGLFVVAEWKTVFRTKPWYTVISIQAMRKVEREHPAWKTYDDFYGSPGLSYEYAIKLAKNLRK